MKANLLWVCMIAGMTTAAWFAPHEAAPVIVFISWVVATWWGYAAAYGEIKR